MSNNQNEFKVIFDGKLELISIEVLISNLTNTTNILREINREFEGPKIDISIKPFAPGSFEIIYAIAQAALASGLLDTLIKGYDAYLEQLISTLSKIFNLKKFLGGEKPKEALQEGDKVKITRNDNSIIYVDNRTYNFYKCNNFINDSLNKSFRKIDENEEIEAFLIKDKEDKELFEAKREEFKEMYAQNPLIEEGEQYKIVEDARLVIFKIVWEPGYKWGFIYEGTKINAYIKDEESFNKIKADGFYEGDYFIARLKITQRYDEKVKTYINDDYEIEEIKEHIKIPKQKSLGFHEK